MLALISPAKKLDFETDTTITDHTQPSFLGCNEELVRAVRKLSRTQLASTMNLSDKLAELNFRRFKDFMTPFDLSNATQAALVFNGDTYVGLQAGSLTEKDMAYAQDHLRILSGLYGLLRPLDLMQPYRLEMGAKFCAPVTWAARVRPCASHVPPMCTHAPPLCRPEACRITLEL